jgi:DNA-binding NtrC family response regulator
MPETDSEKVASGPRGRILVIDDEDDIRESLETLLTLEGYAVDEAANGGEGLRKLETREYDLILLDLMMPDRSGMDVLKDIRQRDRDVPVFMVTAYGSIPVAVEALKAGATDFIPKPWRNEQLLIEIERVLSGRRLERENILLKRALKQRYSFPNIVGKSDRMLRILDLVSQVAPSRSNILITGETGTGKELIAKAIHANSPRSDEVFFAVNSGSLPPELLESTLFGHTKGSFTGAIASQKGYFEIANHGTIFFDEIGTLSMDMQARLLRVIQEKEFRQIGSAEVIRVDVRVLAATNADLKKLVEEKFFREDLFYRLNVINLSLPPLRERREDIPLLVEHFFDKYCQENEKFVDSTGRSQLRFEPDAMQVIMEHNWPGNVRELENAIERAVVLTEGPLLSEEDLPVDVAPLSQGGVRIPGSTMAEIERFAILSTLEATGGSTSKAAEMLDISVRTIQYRLNDYRVGARSRTAT